MKYICSLLPALVLRSVCLAQDAQQDSIAARDDLRRFHEYHARKMYKLEVHTQERLRQKELFRLKPFDSSYLKGLAVGTNLATITDPVEWGPTFTAEYRFARRWSVGGSLKGILISGRTDPGKVYYDPPYESKGFRVTVNAKYFLPWAKSYKWFVGLEGVYKRLDYTAYMWESTRTVRYLDTFADNFLQLQSETQNPARTAVHTQYTVGGGPVFGVQHAIGKHFQFEWYMGLYLVHKQISRHGMLPSATERSPNEGFYEWLIGPLSPGNDESFSHNAWDVKLPLGFRFSYCFGNHRTK